MKNNALLGPWIRRFLLEYLIGERNLSINTQGSYRDMLILLLPFATDRLKKPIDRLNIEDLSTDLVRQFLNNLEQQRNCSIATRNQRLGAIHALARFVGEHSPEHIAWCAQIRLIPYKKTVQPAVGYLDKQEMNALLAAPNQRTAQGRRDYALLLFLYNSGARASEAASLCIQDLNERGQFARIAGKGGKQRMCPLWPATFDALRPLIGNRSSVEQVFLNRCGRPITRFGIHTMVERYALEASQHVPSLASKRVSPHSIRHATATHLLRAGVDINTIRGWLGHASLNTTNVYAEVDLEAKGKALSCCTPSDVQLNKPWKSRPDLMDYLRAL